MDFTRDLMVNNKVYLLVEGVPEILGVPAIMTEVDWAGGGWGAWGWIWQPASTR